MFRYEPKTPETPMFPGLKRSFFCMDCFRVFEREIPLEFSAFAADMRAAHCPDCGADWLRIGFHKTKPVGV